MVAEWSWTSNGMIALYIALGVVVAGIAAWFVMRKTLRTRLDVQRQLRKDPDINDWLVIFGWSPKVLYVPTMAAAVLASVLMFLSESGWPIVAGIDPKVVGGFWFAIFFLNLLIEEYNITIKLLLIAIIGTGFLLLWLHLLGWVLPFLHLLTHLAFSISAVGYLLIAIIGLLLLTISWVHGLFYYAAITPNCLDLHVGPTEAGEQVGREDYNSKIDTGDFLERLLGFGRISITFKSNTRPPLTMLVWRVEKKAEMLERVRAKFAVDHPQMHRPLPAGLQEISPPPEPPAV